MFNNLLHLSFEANSLWLIIGFIGQGLFFMRFLVQWIATEKAKKSVIPDLFWYFRDFSLSIKVFGQNNLIFELLQQK